MTTFEKQAAHINEVRALNGHPPIAASAGRDLSTAFSDGQPVSARVNDSGRLQAALNRHLAATGRVPVGQYASEFAQTVAAPPAHGAFDDRPLTQAAINNPNRLNAAIERHLRKTGRVPKGSR